MPPKVLVTGASGALGRVLCTRLATEFTPGVVLMAKSSREKGKDFLDLKDVEQIKDWICKTRPDWVFHLAATFSDDFDLSFALNVRAAQALLEATQSVGHKARLVFMGSAAEYGYISDTAIPVCEEHPLRPISIYGLTKSWQTKLAEMYSERGVDVVVARIFNLLGEGMSDLLLLGRLHKQILEILMGQRKKIEVGSLAAIRDYVSLEDAVTQIMAIARHGLSGEVYHVASGKPILIKDLIIGELRKKGLSVDCVLENASQQHWQGQNVPKIYADMTKTKRLMSI